MGVLDKLSRFITGDVAGIQVEATTAIIDCYVECTRRARQLARHAEMAPNEQGARGLRELAAEEEEQANRLREALHAVNAPLPTIAAEPLPLGASNHWARLVQDLEAHRSSMRRLRELAIRFAEDLPSTAALFDQMSRDEFTHAEQLRALIARADPQAID